MEECYIIMAVLKREEVFVLYIKKPEKALQWVQDVKGNSSIKNLNKALKLMCDRLGNCQN